MNIGDLMKQIAPAIGTALAGPLGGVAASIVADKLGVQENTVKAVTSALADNKLTADQIVQVKQAELEFQKFLDDNKIKLEAIDAGDRKSARDMQVAIGSWVPGVMAVLVTIGFFGILAYMLGYDYKPSEALLVMLGSLGTAWVSIIGFYYGSSHGSRTTQQALVDKIADSKPV